MSNWSAMNVAAWVLSAVIFVRIAWDFIGVERARREQDRDGETRKDEAQ